ncbi:hypothetical protein BGZ73_002534 [Actinomortierella ambigua]|nr:hypothetical protein BGZ73_002534 [Actinomortierella ambigua]
MDPDSSPDLPPLKRGTYDIEAILAAAENAEFAIPPPARNRIANSFEPSNSFSTAFDTTITPATVAAASKTTKKPASSNNSAASTPTSRLGARRGTVTRVSPAAGGGASSSMVTTPPSAATPQRTDLEPFSDHTRPLQTPPAGAGAVTMEDMSTHAEENGFQTNSRFQSRRTAGTGPASAAAAARLSNRSSPLIKGTTGSPSGPYPHVEEPTSLSRTLSPLNPRSRRGSIGGGRGANDSSFAFSSPSSSRPGSRPESRGSFALRSRDLSNDSLLSFNVMIEQEGLDDEDDPHHGLSVASANVSSSRLPFFLSDPEHIKMLEGEIEDPFSPNSSSLMDDHDPMLLREQLAGQTSLTSPLGSRRGLVRGQSPRRSQRRMLQQQLQQQQHPLAQQVQQHQQLMQQELQQNSRSFKSNDSDNSRGSERHYTDANGFLSPEHGPTRHRDHSSSLNNSIYNTSYDSSPHSLVDGEPGNISVGGGGGGSFSGSSHQGDSSGVLSSSERRKLARLERRKKLLDSIKTSADPLETVSSLAVASPTSPPDSAHDKYGEAGGSGSGAVGGLGLVGQFDDHNLHHHQDQPWYSQQQDHSMHHHPEDYGSHHDGSFGHSFDHSAHHSMTHGGGYGYEGMDDDLHHSGFHLADSSPYQGPDDDGEMQEPRATSFAEWMSHSADISRLDLKSPISRTSSPLGGQIGGGPGGPAGLGGAGKDAMASLNSVAAAANAAVAGPSSVHGAGGAGGMLPTSSSITGGGGGVGNILLSPAFSSESGPITGSSPLFQSLQTDSSLHPSSTPMAPSVLTSSFSPALSPDVNPTLMAGEPTPTSVPLGSDGLFQSQQQQGSGTISAAALGIGSGGGALASMKAALGFTSKSSPPGDGASSSSLTPGATGAAASAVSTGGTERSKELSPTKDLSVVKTVEVAFETEEQIAANAEQRPSSRTGQALSADGSAPSSKSRAVVDGDKKAVTTLAESALSPPSVNGDGRADGEGHDAEATSQKGARWEGSMASMEGEQELDKKEDSAHGGSPTLSPTNKSVASTKSSESGGAGGPSIIRRPSGLLVSARIRDSTNLDAPRYSIREMEEMKKNARMDLRIEITNEIREEYEKTAEQEAALFQFEIQQLKTALEKEEHDKAQLKAVLDEFEASLEDIALNTTKELSTIKEENTRLTEEKEEVEKSFVLLKTRYDELIAHNEKHVENERVLRGAIEALKLDYENAEARYEKVKTHAETKLSEAQVELEAMRMMYEQELAVMRTTMMQQQQHMAQQHQIEKRELEMKLEAKTRENEELIQFSEELIAKLG